MFAHSLFRIERRDFPPSHSYAAGRLPGGGGEMDQKVGKCFSRPGCQFFSAASENMHRLSGAIEFAKGCSIF